MLSSFHATLLLQMSADDLGGSESDTLAQFGQYLWRITSLVAEDTNSDEPELEFRATLRVGAGTRRRTSTSPSCVTDAAWAARSCSVSCRSRCASSSSSAATRSSAVDLPHKAPASIR